ncbi:MAG: cyclic pyranopterin monophosphate synthase MoaC [Phycisphaerae bacterium]|nr:cyclic pyranopterin monophosphate synthase MoaC [Phycisphaerae bacterium]|tara:strand:+ start:686 stop:1144 length:459 start_codon:yes stop_codon:yes gene_type:complete
MDSPLTHIDDRGQASMVDVSGKPPIRREAVAEGRFIAKKETIDRLLRGDLPKGEAMAVARIAGIQAAKDCSRTIPLCHPLPLEHVSVEFHRADATSIRIRTSTVVVARTGIEMEALSAVAGAALCLWDMTKAIDDTLSIDSIHLVEKRKAAN